MFTEGFISELVGRRATINDLPIGKVTDFLVRKPDATFPQIDGLIVKTVQGHALRADRDRHRRRPQRDRRPDHGSKGAGAARITRNFTWSPISSTSRSSTSTAARSSGSTTSSWPMPAANCAWSRPMSASPGCLRRLGLKSFGKRFAPGIYRRVPRSMIAWDSVAPIRTANPSEVSLSVKESKLARLHPVGAGRDHQRPFGARGGGRGPPARRRDRRRRVRTSRRRHAEDADRGSRHRARRGHHRGDGLRRRRRSAGGAAAKSSSPNCWPR